MFGAIASAVGSTAGSLIGGIYQNEQNRRERKNQQDWQASMANTSYQRSVADLRAAGLNPMLAYSQGGAETPSGGMAQMENVGEGLASTALDSIRLREEIKQIRENVKKTAQETKTSEAQEKLIEANTAGAQGDAKVKQALGKTAEILSPGLDKVKQVLGINPKREQPNVEIKRRD